MGIDAAEWKDLIEKVADGGSGEGLVQEKTKKENWLRRFCNKLRNWWSN